MNGLKCCTIALVKIRIEIKFIIIIINIYVIINKKKFHLFSVRLFFLLKITLGQYLHYFLVFNKIIKIAKGD